MQHVEVSQGAFGKLVLHHIGGMSIADKVNDLFHDESVFIPGIPEEGITPAYLKELGSEIRNAIGLPASKLCTFKNQDDLLQALGAFWIGEFPYNDRSAWRMHGKKTTVVRCDEDWLTVTQQPLDVPGVYVPIGTEKTMQIREHNWPTLVYLAAAFIRNNYTQQDLNHDVSEWCSSEAELSSAAARGVAIAAKQYLGTSSNTSLMHHSTGIQIPYVQDGKLYFASKQMRPEDVKFPLGDIPITIAITPEEGRNFFVATLHCTGLPARIGRKLVRQAYR